MNDLISIIIPVYNVEQYIKKCVDSVIGQTYRNLEIILVDDGSTDNSGRICDELATLDKRIVVIHKQNGGLSDARNAGIRIARGKYLGFVDSDDYIENEMYSVLMNNLKQTDSDLSACARILINENETKTPDSTVNIVHCFESSTDAIADLFAYNEFLFHAAWDKLYKRELFDDIEFPVGRLFEDAAVMYKIFEKCKRIVATKKQMYYYVQRKGSISNCAYNEKKVKHQLENRLNAINYYENKNTELCILAAAWNIRFAYNIWNEACPYDKDTANFILKASRRNFHFSLCRYLGKKQFIKGLLFCINPHIVRLYCSLSKGRNEC